jgi:Domain of unknown function (DUF4419)
MVEPLALTMGAVAWKPSLQRFERRFANPMVMRIRSKFSRKKFTVGPFAVLNRKSFEVDGVTPATQPLPTGTLAECIEHRVQRKILVLPGAEDRVVNEYPVRSELLPELVESSPARAIPRVRRSFGPISHSLIDVIHTAFSQHRPLALSPDTIWMVIAQGFGHHVDANAKELRSQLVRHEGKKVLEVNAQELTMSGFASAIGEFSERIGREINPVLHETLICDFSTTTPRIRTACEVALMDTFSHYFTYSMVCVCGIPKITIEGTPEDWRRIRARVEVLATHGLEWWVSRLRPILDEFILAAEGRARIEFWQAIYKPRKSYVSEIVTGWIADLFPYLGDPPHRRRSTIFDCERRDWAVPTEFGVGGKPHPFPGSYKKEPGVGRDSFPSGLSSARLNIRFPNNAEAKVDLLGGFVAMKQDERDLSLSPLISWCVAELPPEQPI